jgi:Na+-transporting NADH:ubiquinone oxidoreductase subunit F
MNFPFMELLQSVLIISSIATFLAVLIVIADATIGNYGEKKLKINDDTEYTVDGGQTLLNALKEEAIFIPSACGGRGSCGLCKVKVESGVGDYLATELPWITDSDKKEGIRVSCQVKVKEDMSLRIPEELFNVKEFETRVVKIVDLTEDIKGIHLEIIGDEQLLFKPGQFVQLEVPEYELTDEPIYRAYSIASVPSDTKTIELQIKLVPQGICTTYVHKHLKEGDKITINGPYGDFFLQDTDAEMVCMAVGSGMAPIKSIISYMAEHKIQRKVTYFYGARTRSDLFDLDIMVELANILPNFTFVPVLSRPTEKCGWEGEVGRINTILPSHFESTAGMEAYLCGAPQALDAFVVVLKELGMDDETIYYDPF